MKIEQLHDKPTQASAGDLPGVSGWLHGQLTDLREGEEVTSEPLPLPQTAEVVAFLLRSSEAAAFGLEVSQNGTDWTRIAEGQLEAEVPLGRRYAFHPLHRFVRFRVRAANACKSVDIYAQRREWASCAPTQ